jgi:hypothetical protein
VYKTKDGFNGKFTKLKVHLMAHGLQQRIGIDYNNFFALIVKWNTIRIVLSMVANNNWDILHLDVKTAFLNGNLKKPVYIFIPKGFNYPNSQKTIC